MRAEVVAVGTEILLGQIANTNARTISEGLAAAGVDVMYHWVVGDNEARIALLLREALARSDVIIITGGLGPTQDDLTREAIARATGKPLERRVDLEEGLRERFARFGRVMVDANLKQADQPQGAVAIPNPRGSAPGIALEHEGKWIYAMPGVPHEMEAMFRDAVLPRIAALAGGAVLVSRSLKVAGVPESEVAERLGGVVSKLDSDRSATIAFLPAFGEVQIRITAKDSTEEAARGRIAPVEQEVRDLLGQSVFGVDGDTLPGVIAELIKGRGLSLAIAESVTGGMVASRIVEVPGASDFLKAGFVAYSNESKVRDLSVPPALIGANGAVSEAVAVSMAQGARLRAETDLGLATTGEAGPDAREAPAGSVFVALAWSEGSVSRGFVAPGGRELVRRWATVGALNLLRLWLMGEKL